MVSKKDVARSTLEKVKKFRKSRPDKTSDGFKKTKDIFYKFEEGDNHIRLVGEFLECRQHFIASSKKTGSMGVVNDDAFKGDDRIPKMINCLNWDPQNEEEIDGGCPICKIHQLTRDLLKEIGEGDPEEKKYLESIKDATRLSTSLKWNIIDRRSPEITEVDENGKESKVLGFKVANIGMEAWGDIDSIYKQVQPTDVAGIDEGIDINVVRSYNGRTCYSAQIVMEGTHAKLTPLTDEERALELHDLRRIVGGHPNLEDLIKHMKDDMRQLLESMDEEDSDDDSTEDTTDDKEDDVTFDSDDGEDDDDDDDEEKFECFGEYEGDNVECQKCTQSKACKKETNK